MQSCIKEIRWRWCYRVAGDWTPWPRGPFQSHVLQIRCFLWKNTTPPEMTFIWEHSGTTVPILQAGNWGTERGCNLPQSLSRSVAQREKQDPYLKCLTVCLGWKAPKSGDLFQTNLRSNLICYLDWTQRTHIFSRVFSCFSPNWWTVVQGLQT